MRKATAVLGLLRKAMGGFMDTLHQISMCTFIVEEA